MSAQENERNSSKGFQAEEINRVGDEVWCYGTYNGIPERLFFSPKDHKRPFDSFGIHRELPFASSSVEGQIVFGYDVEDLTGQNVRFSTAVPASTYRQDHVIVPFDKDVFEPVAYVPWMAIVRNITAEKAHLLTPGGDAPKRLIPVGRDRRIDGRKMRFDKLGRVLAVTVDSTIDGVTEMIEGPNGSQEWQIEEIPVMVRAQFPDPQDIFRNSPEAIQRIIGRQAVLQLFDDTEAADFFTQLRSQIAESGYSLSLRPLD